MANLPSEVTSLVYMTFMEEVKVRCAVIQKTIIEIGDYDTLAGQKSDKVASVEDIFSAEYCYHHFRKITELIAIGNLAVHHQDPNFPINSKHLTITHPNRLLTELKKINPNAYPAPCKAEAESDGSFTLTIAPGAEEAPDIIGRIYAQSSDRLHLTLKAALKDGGKLLDLAELNQWRNDIINILGHHAVRLPDGKTALLVSMGDDAELSVSCGIHRFQLAHV